MNILLKKVGVILIFGLFSFCACTDLSPIESDIESLNNRVTSLEGALNQLKKAYAENKIISTVTSTSANNGWVITFTDQQSITVVNGANESSIIKSIVEDKDHGIITLTMQDGSVFIFNQYTTIPTSVSLLSKKVYLTKKGNCSFDFVVNPSNAVVNLDLDSENSSIVLNIVGKSRGSYIETPTNFSIKSITADSEKDDQNGVYHVTLEDLGKNSNYVENVTVVIRTKNGKGEDIEISSDVITVEWRNGEDFYDFRIGECVGMFDGNNVIVELPVGTVVTGLTPSFKTNGKVYVGGKLQVSGVSVQNFSSPKEYSVTAANGSVADYIVSVKFK